MKKTFSVCSLKAQWGVTYHQSALSYFGVNKQVGKSWLPELRLGTNLFVEDVPVELMINYQWVNKDEYQFYTGISGWANQSDVDVVIPLGFNFFPLENKRFGFHTEIGFFISDEVLRGSFGLRYRFLK